MSSCRHGTAVQQPKLVLLDGEGLGHTPKSVAAISTSLTRRIESTDAIVLVDNAVQPMQAARAGNEGDDHVGQQRRCC